jgi:hypothetical protein
MNIKIMVRTVLLGMTINFVKKIGKSHTQDSGFLIMGFSVPPPDDPPSAAYNINNDLDTFWSNYYLYPIDDGIKNPLAPTMTEKKVSAPTHHLICTLNSLNPKFQNITIQQESVELGRSVKLPPAFRIDEYRISLKHIRIFREDNTFYVKDMRYFFIYANPFFNSTNGTYVNGKRLEKGKKVELRNGDELSLIIPNSKHKLANGVYILSNNSDSLL